MMLLTRVRMIRGRRMKMRVHREYSAALTSLLLVTVLMVTSSTTFIVRAQGGLFESLVGTVTCSSCSCTSTSSGNTVQEVMNEHLKSSCNDIPLQLESSLYQRRYCVDYSIYDYKGLQKSLVKKCQTSWVKPECYQYPVLGKMFTICTSICSLPECSKSETTNAHHLHLTFIKRK